MTQIDYDAMAEILSENGITATDEQIKDITDQFINHRQCLSDMESEQFRGSFSECESCKNLKEQIKDLQHDHDIYKQFARKKAGDKPVFIRGGDIMFDNR
jgi:hypothetical protein